MSGTNGQSGYQPGFWGSIWHTITTSVSEVFTQTKEEIGAIPSFVKTTSQHKGSRNIFANMGKIITTDLVPIISVEVLVRWLKQFYAPTSNYDPSFVLSTGIAVLEEAKKLYVLRKTIEALTRNMIINAGVATTNDKATAGRAKLDSSISCMDCTKERYVKGYLRAPLVYVSQQITLYILNNFLGDLVKIRSYDLLVDNYRAQVLGQLIIDLRLANDGLCERHQTEFNRQFWERVFMLGLPVVLLKKIIESGLESLTGVERSFYGSIIETFLTIGMMGLTHHMKLPQPVEKSDRWLNPASMIRSATANAMDIVGPGLIKFVKALFTKKGEPFNYDKAYDAVIRVYKHPYTRAVLVVFIPEMYLGPKAFVNDWVVEKQWPAIQCVVLQGLGGFDKHHHWVEKRSVKLVENSTGVLSWFLGWYTGISTKTVRNGDELVHDKSFLDMLAKMHLAVNEMKVKVDQKGVLGEITSAFIPPIKYWREAWQHFTKPTQPVEYMIDFGNKVMPMSMVIEQIQASIESYITTKHPQKQEALKVLTSSSGHKGEMRALACKALLGSQFPDNQRLVVCFSILVNTGGYTMRNTIKVGLKRMLIENGVRCADDRGWQKVLDNIETAIYQSFDCKKNSSCAKELNRKMLEMITHMSSSPTRLTILQVANDTHQQMAQLIGDKRDKDTNRVEAALRVTL